MAVTKGKATGGSLSLFVLYIGIILYSTTIRLPGQRATLKLGINCNLFVIISEKTTRVWFFNIFYMQRGVRILYYFHPPPISVEREVLSLLVWNDTPGFEKMTEKSNTWAHSKYSNIRMGEHYKFENIWSKTHYDGSY